MFGDLLQVGGERSDRVVDLVAPALVHQRHRHADRLLHLAKQFDGQGGEIVDEVERVLDLVRDARGELAERGHILRLDQIGLRRLQLAIRSLGRIARGADLLFAVLAFGDVGVDQHEPTLGNRIVAHLDHAPVGTSPLVHGLPVAKSQQPERQLIGIGAELAALRQVLYILRVGAVRGHRPIRHIEDRLEPAVPGDQTGCRIEHGDPVSHVLRGLARQRRVAFSSAVVDLASQIGDRWFLRRAHRDASRAGCDEGKHRGGCSTRSGYPFTALAVV
jgi:hypothetical protein